MNVPSILSDFCASLSSHLDDVSPTSDWIGCQGYPRLHGIGLATVTNGSYKSRSFYSSRLNTIAMVG